MAAKQPRYSLEFREEAARMVVAGSRVIAQVVRELGLGVTTFGELGAGLPGGAQQRRAAAGIVGERLRDWSSKIGNWKWKTPC
jgi:transposase-like protein